MINDYHYGPNKTSVEYGKDTSLDLVTTVLDHASEESDLDAIILNGDFVRHGFGRDEHY